MRPHTLLSLAVLSLFILYEPVGGASGEGNYPTILILFLSPSSKAAIIMRINEMQTTLALLLLMISMSFSTHDKSLINIRRRVPEDLPSSRTGFVFDAKR